MALLRKILFWTHLALGVAAGVVILIMSVTGVLLTYQRQITAWADSGIRVEAKGERAPVAALLATARSVAPDAKPTAITYRAPVDAPASIALGRGRTLFLDPYTAASLGEGSTRVRTFFRVTTDLHRWLAMKDASRDTARKITGASNLAFLFLVISGMFLWIPRGITWVKTRAVLLPRRGLRGKARDFNWHHVAGIWFAIPLVVVVASGVVISYPWASALVYRVVGEQPPAPQPSGSASAASTANTAGAARTRDEGRSRDGITDAPSPSYTSLDTMLTRAMAHTTGWRTVAMQLPQGSAKKISVTIDAGDGGQPQLRRTLAFDRVTGAIVTDEGFAKQTAGRRLRSILRFAHTGEVLGVPGQTIAGLASLAGVILVWTGLALSFRRLAAMLRRRRAEIAMPELAVAKRPEMVEHYG